MEKRVLMGIIGCMTDREKPAAPGASLEEIQQGWEELRSRVAQLEAERGALEQENKALRFLIERVIDHRQKSHSELVLLLTTLVSKLPIGEIGVLVAKLVEHNANVSQFLAALGKGTADANMPQPEVLKTLEQTKRDLAAAVKPLVEELVRLGTPLERELLQGLVTEPELFFSPRLGRANRCYVKGCVPRERIVREFGEPALSLFNDLTTDAKLNPHPKPEEIVLGFRSDFEERFGQDTALIANKRQELLALYRLVQRSKGRTEEARAQKSAFQRLSFVVELLHYYEHQTTEAPDAVFAQRLPALIEQLVLAGPEAHLDEKLIVLAEGLLAFVISPEHRHTIINNLGKVDAAGKTLKYVLRLRGSNVADSDAVIAEFIRHLIPAPRKAPAPAILAAVLRLIHPDMQRRMVKSIMRSDRIRKDEAEALARALSEELGLKWAPEEAKAEPALPPEMERQQAWYRIHDLIAHRSDPSAIAAAIRDRLHAKYNGEELRQSWLTLIEAEPMVLIRIFCQIPYLAEGKTDSIARTVLETYVTRLTHEKYAATYHKVVNSLRNMFKAKPDSPTLVNFTALVRWVDPAAADRLCGDIGMPIPAH